MLFSIVCHTIKKHNHTITINDTHNAMVIHENNSIWIISKRYDLVLAT